jgi:hypothetical protein
MTRVVWFGIGLALVFMAARPLMRHWGERPSPAPIGQRIVEAAGAKPSLLARRRLREKRDALEKSLLLRKEHLKEDQQQEDRQCAAWVTSLADQQLKLEQVLEHNRRVEELHQGGKGGIRADGDSPTVDRIAPVLLTEFVGTLQQRLTASRTRLAALDAELRSIDSQLMAIYADAAGE